MKRWVIYLEVEFLSHKTGASLALLDIAKLLSKVVGPVYTSTTFHHTLT